MKKEDIVKYYDQCEIDYKLLWDLNHSHAMHAGFWDSTTRCLRDALRRENEILADMAKIKRGERILDAGCGVGGSSLFLAEKYQCKVTGISLSEKQIKTARRKAEEHEVSSLASFEVMDYTKTQFADESFDVIWGIESICHAPDKKTFIQEAKRLLKPSGRLIVADGFASSFSTNQNSLMKTWLAGWGVDNLETKDQFHQYLYESGFSNVAFKNMNQQVWPSAKRLYWYSLPAIGLSRIGELVGLRTKVQTANLHSARCQYLALKKGLWEYGIFLAEKK